MKNLTLIICSLLCVSCASAGIKPPTTPMTEKQKLEIAVDNIEKEIEADLVLPLVVLPNIPEYELTGNEFQIWVNKNDLAPYDGILLTPEAMSLVVSSYDSQKEMYELTIQKQYESDFEVLKIETGKLKVELESQKKKSDTRLEFKDKEIQRLQKINEDISKSKSNILRDILFAAGGVGVGIIAGVIIMSAAN